jgi:hypothetical protein
MGEPRTLWVTLTNVALGVAVLVSLATVVFPVLGELTARVGKRTGGYTGPGGAPGHRAAR